MKQWRNHAFPARDVVGRVSPTVWWLEGSFPGSKEAEPTHDRQRRWVEKGRRGESGLRVSIQQYLFCTRLSRASRAAFAATNDKRSSMFPQPLCWQHAPPPPPPLPPPRKAQHPRQKLHELHTRDTKTFRGDTASVRGHPSVVDRVTKVCRPNKTSLTTKRKKKQELWGWKPAPPPSQDSSGPWQPSWCPRVRTVRCRSVSSASDLTVSNSWRKRTSRSSRRCRLCEYSMTWRPCSVRNV